MARRRKSSSLSGGAIGLLLFLGGIVWLFQTVWAAIPPIEITGPLLVAGVVLVLLVVGARRSAARRHEKQQEQLRLEVEYRTETARALAASERRERLLQDYDDEAIVDAIIRGDVWQYMTKKQLVESWGPPSEIDTKVLKTKVKETYKYGWISANRFGRRVYIENDVVVGWEL